MRFYQFKRSTNRLINSDNSFPAVTPGRGPAFHPPCAAPAPGGVGPVNGPHHSLPTPGWTDLLDAGRRFFCAAAARPRARMRGCRIHAAPPRGGRGESPHPQSLSLSLPPPLLPVVALSFPPRLLLRPPRHRLLTKDAARRTDGSPPKKTASVGHVCRVKALHLPAFLPSPGGLARRRGPRSAVGFLRS